MDQLQYTASGGNASAFVVNISNTTLPSVIANITDSNLSVRDQHVYPTIRQPVHMIAIYTLVYSIVFLLGIIGRYIIVYYKSTVF